MHKAEEWSGFAQLVVASCDKLSLQPVKSLDGHATQNCHQRRYMHDLMFDLLVDYRDIAFTETVC